MTTSCEVVAFPRSWAAGIFLSALAVRLLVVAQLRTLPIWRVPWLDSLEYLEWARRLVENAWYWPSYPSHGPGYPYFLAAVLALTGGSLPAVGAVQAVLGALSCLLTARLAARAFSRRAGAVAGLLQAAYGPLIIVETSLFAEGLLIALILATLGAALPRPPYGLTRWLSSGALIGLAVAVRPTAAALLPLLIVLAWRNGAAPAAGVAARRGGIAVFLLLAAAAVPVVPVLVANARTAGSAMIQGHAGMNYYLGNSPAGNGLPSARLGADWDRLERAAAARGLTRPQDQDRYYVRAAWAEIRERPLAWARLLGSKLLWLVQADEIRDSHSFYFFRDAIRTLALLPAWGVVFPLTAIGLFAVSAPAGVRPEGPRDARWLAAALVLLSLTCVGLVVGSRYRLPLAPLAIAFAGHGAVTLLAAANKRAWSRLGLLAGVGAIALILTQVRHHADSRNLAEEWTFTGNSLMAERNYPEAESAYRRALAIDPRSDYAWDAFGLAALRLQRPDEARSAFTRVIALSPDSAKGHFHLGFLEEQQGRAAEAVAPLRRAVALAPENLEAWRALGRALLISGSHREAGDIFRRLVRQVPEAPDVSFGLAWLAEQDGAVADGMVAARRAVELQPGNGEAWFLLGRLAILGGDAATAEAALAQARSLLPQPSPAIDASLARLRQLRSAAR